LQHAAPEEHQLPRHLSKAFRAVLARMVAKNPAARFGSATELQNALREYLGEPEDPNEIKFPLTRHPQSLDTMFDLGQRLYARGGRPAYEARERATGRLVKLCVAANATGPTEKVNALATKLCKLAELSYEPLLPSSLAPVRTVIRTEDLLAYAEETQVGVGLPDLLKARGTAGRPVPFSEAVMLFYPIAHGLDFLLSHGRETVSLACDEVSIGGPTAAGVPFEPETLALPLTDWNGLRVRFGLMPSPSSFDSESSASEVSVGGTIAGSMQMDAGDSHPLAAFARLVYRVLAGTEVPSLVQFAPDAYAPTVNLSSTSNRLVREVICNQHVWPSATEFLRELCAAEAAPFRGPSHAAVARVIAPGRVRSPYAQGSPPQNLAEKQWLPGREFICAASRRRVALPAELPPWEEPAAPIEFHATPTPNEESPADESSESIQQTVVAPPEKSSSSSRQSSHVVEHAPASTTPARTSFKRSALLAAGAITILVIGAGIYWKLPPGSTSKPEPRSTEDLAFDGKAPGELRTFSGINFHWCPATGPAGFTMGSPDSEEGRGADETRHTVVLTRGFWMA
ncbi:MAG TPA: hypothetical protein VGH90_01170, partial [Chthoniobacteraceae bacterium]